MSQVSLLPIVVDHEERRATLDGGLDHGGRSDLEDGVGVKGGTEGAEDGGSDFEGCRGGFSSDGEVAFVGD